MRWNNPSRGLADSRRSKRTFGNDVTRRPEKLLHGGDVEAAGNLIRPGDGEVLAGGREQAAVLELVLEGSSPRLRAP